MSREVLHFGCLASRPKSYLGKNHETIGSDILAVLESVKLADVVLGAERTQRLRAIAPTGWYPIETLLEPLEFIAARLGDASLKKVGWNLFKLSHEARFKAEAKSVRDLAYGIDVLYHRANRGEGIGGWSVLEFVPGRALLEKTTPHPCVMEEGILEGGLRALAVTGIVSQRQCVRKGADCCHLEIMSPIRDERWG